MWGEEGDKTWENTVRVGVYDFVHTLLQQITLRLQGRELFLITLDFQYKYIFFIHFRPKFKSSRLNFSEPSHSGALGVRHLRRRLRGEWLQNVKRHRFRTKQNKKQKKTRTNEPVVAAVPTAAFPLTSVFLCHGVYCWRKDTHTHTHTH